MGKVDIKSLLLGFFIACTLMLLTGTGGSVRGGAAKYELVHDQAGKFLVYDRRTGDLVRHYVVKWPGVAFESGFNVQPLNEPLPGASP